MARDKKSFVAYADWNKTFEKLSDDEAGKLAKMMFSFVSDENPEAPDRITELLFEPIKNQLERDLEKYKEVRQKRVEAGRNGGVKSGEVRSKTEQNEASASNSKQNEAVIVNGNVNDNDILFTKESKLREVWELFRGKRNSFEKDFKAFEKKTEGIDVDFEKLKTEAVKSTNVYFQTWLNDFVPKSSGTGGAKSFTKDDFLKKLINLGADEKDSMVWMEVRKQKKAVFTEYVIDLIVEECNRHSLDFSEAIKYSAKYSWQGFDYEWYQNKKNKENGTNNTKQSNSNGQGYSGGSSQISGKTSFNAILARKLKASGDSEGGNITIDAEVVE